MPFPALQKELKSGVGGNFTLAKAISYIAAKKVKHFTLAIAL